MSKASIAGYEFHSIGILEEPEIHVEFVIEIEPVVFVQVVINVTIDSRVSGSVSSVPFEGILMIHALIILVRMLGGYGLMTGKPEVESRIEND